MNHNPLQSMGKYCLTFACYLFRICFHYTEHKSCSLYNNIHFLEYSLHLIHNSPEIIHFLLKSIQHIQNKLKLIIYYTSVLKLNVNNGVLKEILNVLS